MNRKRDHRILRVHDSKCSFASFSLAISLCFLSFGLLSLSAASQAANAFPAESLHIVAVIDGSDDLHISQKTAKWVHKSWNYPTEVNVNGYVWNPQAVPVLNPARDGGLLARDLDLAGAVLHKLRGRGTVQLGRDADGLVISFDDPEGGSDTYEVTLDFAQPLARKSAAASTNTIQLWLRATIDGMDDIWFSGRQATWSHTGWSPATGVMLNDTNWDTIKHPVMQLPTPLLPETLDLQNATLEKMRGRGSTTLQYEDERLNLSFEDYPDGADLYEALVEAPPFHQRKLVSIKADLPNLLLGAALKIYRLPGHDDEARDVLAGQRVFDSSGRCLAALEPGEYEFEVLHKAVPDTLIALKTGRVSVAGATNIDLNPVRIQPGLLGPNRQKMSLDEIGIRSSRRTGNVSWKQQTNSQPTVIVSRGQDYRISAFGHAGGDFVALWKSSSVTDLATLAIESKDWLECSFRWQEGTPRAVEKGIVLHFPDGEQEMAPAENVRLFTNRRYFNVGYWLGFAGGRKAAFQSQGHVLSRKTNEILLGAPLHALASAAIMKNETPKDPNALSLWWEITLGDAQGYLLDAASSKINWAPVIEWKEGGSVPAGTLSAGDIKRLGNLTNTLTARATYMMETNESIAAAPESFVTRRFQRLTTEAPPYRSWNTTAYLSKAERELNYIFEVRQTPNDPRRHIHIGWWMNSGAVGGGNSVTMPVTTYLDCWSWYTHTWAIAHEMLHTFGVGHTREMLRLDHKVQERMEFFQWYIADHPEYIPEDWENPPKP